MTIRSLSSRSLSGRSVSGRSARGRVPSGAPKLVAAVAACGLAIVLAADPSSAAPRRTTPNRAAAARAAKGDDRTPATLSLACRADGGGARCAWTGSAPAGAKRQLLLRSDGRVRLDTIDVTVRTHLDGSLPSATSFSYVVVFLDASGKALAHSNAAVVTAPAAARR